MRRPLHRRGDATRAALLQAAIEVFARDGYQAASTREIAIRAGANQAAIGYHFGAKHGLYLAAFELIDQSVSARLKPVLDSIAPRVVALDAADPGGKAMAFECAATIVTELVGIFGAASAGDWVRLIMREQQDPTEAFEMIYRDSIQPALALLDTLLAILRDESQAGQPCKVHSLLLWGQMFAFLAARATTLRHLQRPHLGDAELDVLRTEMIAALGRLVPAVANATASTDTAPASH